MRKLEYLSSLCEERTTFTFRIMRLSAHKVGYSDFIESVVLLIEYIQLLSQAFLVRFEFYSDSSLHSINLGNLINPIAKGFDLSYITEYNHSTSILVLAIVIFAILVLWRLTLFCYVCYIAMKKSPGNNILVQMWKWIFCIQGRILCFLLTSLLIGFFQSLDNKLETSSLAARCIAKTSFWIFVVVEYIMSIIYKKYFSQVLPNKTFLSSKTDNLVLLTLAQKFMVQVLCISISPSYIADPWMYCVIGLVFDMLRIYHFLTVLPFYKSKALFLQGSLLAMMFSFNIASAFYSILDAAEYSIDLNFLIGLWIILTIIAIKGMRNYLFEIMIKAIMDHKPQSPAISSHRVFLLKEFRSKGETINRYTSKYDWKTLAIKSINNNERGTAGLKGNLDLTNLTSLNSKNALAEFCLKSLNDLSLEFPKDSMLKLYVAYYYAKKVKKYTIALRLLSELQKSSSFTIRFNASLLLEEVQLVLRAINENSQSRLDIFTYTRSRYKVVKLKQNMHKQAQLEIKIYSELQQSFPNLASIFNTAQTVHNQKLKIGKQIKTLNQTLPEYYLEPIMLSAYYHLVLNHLIPEYLECTKKLSERKQKYQKIFNANQLRQENLYQSDAAVVYVSGMRENRGKITYASKKAIELYGHDPVGQDTSVFITPFLMSFWKKFSSHNYETGEFLSPNAMSPMFLYNPSTGYVTATTRFFNVHPFIWAGLHFVSVIRPISDSKEYILISENGEIQGFTEKIAKRLKLATSLESHTSIGIKIGNICPALEEIDKAITLFGRLSVEQREQQAEDPNVQNAKRIYDVYSTTGEVIKMTPLNSPKEFYCFHCRVSSQNFGNMFVKHLTLEEIRQENPVIMESKNLPRSLFVKEELTLQRERSTQANSPLTQPFEPEEIPTTNRSLLFLRDEKDISNNRAPTFAANDMSFQRNSSESIDLDKGKKLVDVNIDTYSMNSQRSNYTSGLRKIRAYNIALASDYYSRKYTIFLILLFTMLCGILINQNVLKIKLDNYVYSLKTRKDVLTIASARSLKLLDIHRNLRSLWWFGIGKLNDTMSRGPGGGPPGIVSRLPRYIRDLSTANKELRIAADRLDPSIRELVFRQDVRMYETNYGEIPAEFINVTNFEATDSIVADCLQVSQQARKNVTKAAPQIGIMLRNIPNDILLQAEEVADLFMDSLHGDMDNNLGIVLRNSAGILSVLFGLLLGFNYTLYSQYIKEKRNMIAIRGFDLKNIHTVQEKLLNFCKLIEEETPFEDLPTTDVQKFYYRRSLATKSNALIRKQETDFWNSVSGISKKYWFYSARLSVFIFCIIGFIVLNMVISIGLTSGLNTKTKHLQLIDSLTENITLLGSIAMDMASENDTTLILNARPSTLYVQTLQDIYEGKNQVLDDFDTNSDGEYDFLAPLLYENQCATLTSDLQGFCMNITGSQKTAGFIQLMTYMESVFVDFKNRFDSSNKSTRALQSFWTEAQTSITRNIVVVQTIAISIETAVDQNLEESISSGLNKNKIISSVTCYSLAVICALIYWTVLVKVRESDNQFKRVLQVFPANVVLSNFILRSYVVKTARGALDFIKSEL